MRRTEPGTGEAAESRLEATCIRSRIAWIATALGLAVGSLVGCARPLIRVSEVTEVQVPPPVGHWTLRGVVVSDSTGDAVEGALVIVSGTPCSGIAMGQGQFELSCREFGDGWIAVRQVGYHEVRVQLAPLVGRTYRLTARLRWRGLPGRLRISAAATRDAGKSAADRKAVRAAWS